MNIVTIDYETYWDQRLTLSKLPTGEYIHDPEFEVISCAIKIDHEPTVILFGEEIARCLARIDWANVACVAHNGAEFDHWITARRYGIRPKLWLDTRQIARYLFHDSIRLRLADLATRLGVGKKGSLESDRLKQTKGKHLHDFTRDERIAMAEYNIQDTELCRAILDALLPRVPVEEIKLMDLTTRMMTEPQLDINLPLIEKAQRYEIQRHARLLDRLAKRFNYADLTASDGEVVSRGVDRLRADLRSTARFRALLERTGVPCPTKWSEKQKKEIPAVAKTDKGMQALLEDPNTDVSDLAAARLETSSSLLATRLGRFLHLGRVSGGKMPVPLQYYGAAATGRWSGAQKLNMQNLPRVDRKNPKLTDVLRVSLQAPPGHVVVVVDLSGIELRVNHHLWRVPSSVEAFQRNRDADLYIQFAADHLYHVAHQEVTDAQRTNAKVAQLQLGYQSGAEKFRETARHYGVTLSAEDAQQMVDVWRGAYPEIAQGWRTCHKAIPFMAGEHDTQYALDPGELCHAVAGGIRTPRGFIRYAGLEANKTIRNGTEYTEWSYYTAEKGRRKLYGGQIVENLCQHLSRYVFTEAILRFAQTPLGKRYPLAGMVHDEVVYVPRESDAEEVLATVVDIMRQPPVWWPELVTSAKGSIALTYGEAK